MNSFSLGGIFNSSLAESVKAYCTDLSSHILHSVFYYTESQTKNILTTIENFPQVFHCDEFQWKLLKVFTATLFLNLVLILIAWKIFGKSICERFMKPGKCQLIFLGISHVLV